MVLDIAPAHLTDAEGAEALRAHDPELAAEQLAHDLACRRYAIDGDPGPLDAYFSGADVTPESPLSAEGIGEGCRLTHRMSDQAAARTLSQALGIDPEGGEIAEKLAERGYAMTGAYRAIEEWEAEERTRTQPGRRDGQ